MHGEWLSILRLRLRALWRRRQLDRDLEEELAFHMATRAAVSGRARRREGCIAMLLPVGGSLTIGVVDALALTG